MHKNKIIHHFTALALLLLFVLGNMPKQWMHDLFANHIDYKNGIVKPTHATSIYQSSFHCQTDHFVVESFFANDAQLLLLNVPLSYHQFKNAFCSVHIVDQYFHSALRGPPVFS